MELPPADPDLVVKVARLGPLGRCLEEALNDLMSRDAHEAEMDDMSESEEGLATRIRQSLHTAPDPDLETLEGFGNDEKDASCDPPTLAARKELLREACGIDSGMVECLMNTLGESVAQTRWSVNVAEEEDDSIVPTTTANQSTREHTNTVVAPPKALLRGRVDHFNRVGGKWRIVATNVEIRQRVNLDTSTNKRTKKRDRSSLWDTSGNAIVEDPSEYNSIQLKGTVQILAYDDV
jgi:hypothetical protein|mmetsp:Transcript_22339/g.40316  ORF Transcript_22339/g.40316 Transcript_22339/m.40316 type:complete len:236 (-) Transcript_22339:54-761(-)